MKRYDKNKPAYLNPKLSPKGRVKDLLSRMALEEKAAQMLRAHEVLQAPAVHASLMVALDFALGPSYEVVIVGNRQKRDMKDMHEALERTFIPNKVVLLRPAEVKHPKILRFAEFTKSLTSQEGRATAYVCRNYQCDLPTTSIEKMLRLLDATK